MDYLVLLKQTLACSRRSPPHFCLQCLGCNSSLEASTAPQCFLILMTSNHACSMSKKGKSNEKGEREKKRERAGEKKREGGLR